eukprot:m.323299 g.323299  ORF g.323299 m.323299 type:complete len:553 (+) comp28809_c0_seq1:34-1692(+)
MATPEKRTPLVSSSASPATPASVSALLSSSRTTTLTSTITRVRQSVQIGFGSEKLAVVLDIGSSYTKCGFATEPSPRHIIPTAVMRDGKAVRVYDPLHPIADDEQKELLADFLFEIFYKRLLVKAQERRVVVCESIMCPTSFRHALADVLFSRLQVLSVCFVPSHLVALLPFAVESALVVDCGFHESAALAVCDGVPVLKTYTCAPFGAKAVQSELEFRLVEGGRGWVGSALKPVRAFLGLADRPLTNEINVIDECVLEDIQVRTLLAGRPPVHNGKTVTADSIPYPLKHTPPGDDQPQTMMLELDHKVRCNTYDVLFDGRYFEEQSMATLILDAIKKCDRDVRRDMAENIVLMGGTCLAPGFRHRLLSELKRNVEMPQYQCLKGKTLERVMLRAVATCTGKPTAGELAFDTQKFKAAIATKLGVSQDALHMFEVEQQGQLVMCSAELDAPFDASPLKGLEVPGKKKYTFDSAEVVKESFSTGLDNAFAFHTSPFPENCLTWVGGAIFGALDILPERSVARDVFNEKRTVPDWTTIYADADPATPAQPKLTK